MPVAVFLLVVAFTIALVLWGRHVFRKHAEEAIYETDEEATSHARDPGFLAKMGDGFHGGSGPGL